ncbi:Ig-like domain-containing alpha-2-macroglobulin family protein [Roseiflexus sp. RS-1]|uniref:Ig-like domain-containing alpha-2-macroglobulin family protein n=1 Tax=Roseiflexus sp. (strain RS-1) TaxID=357808 RepID=UPI0000D7F7BA|nr:Ig-like domain-containing alpha-2-macroglobulin family protein [Roseiflexus sp. RS-1]ABQ89505.1 Large extracellular alpha-helical protein-like protein [Roseiflexus sp. RS-1]
MRFLRQVGLIWTAALLVVVLASLALPGARFLLLPWLSDSPVVVAVSPPDGARDVSPRTALIIQFNTPMNPPGVERALRIEPESDVVYAWDDSRTTLTVTPTKTLQAGMRYRVSIDETALSRFFRPLEEPFVFTFETAPPPAVTSLWPRDGSVEVPVDTLISVRFSRSIVPPDRLAVPELSPAFRTDPPVSGSVVWIDPATLLFRPDQPLRPGVRYTCSLSPDLTDQSGTPLGRAYSWSFTTLAPTVLSVSPPPNARQVALREPLRIVFSQPVDRQALEAALSVTPPMPGALEDAVLPDGTQVVTYTPTAEWQAGVVYTIALPEKTADGSPLLVKPYRWSFMTAPKPALIGRFPGEGQLLPPGGSVRLIFSTPIDAGALRDNLRVEPPVAHLRVVTNDGEARIDAQLQAATLYTITIPASLSDRAGVALERDYQVRFFTAPAAPSLTLPEANGRVIRSLPDRAIDLLTRRTNLSELRLTLYPLDEATLLRALSFSDAEWTSFEPARYGLSPLRFWTQPLTDPLNTVVEERVTVTLDGGAPLPPGFYFLRIRSPERAGAGVLLAVSRVTLSFQVVGQRAIVWVTDIASTSVISDTPLALYRQGTLIAVGRSDERGVWETDLSGVNPRDLVAVATLLPAFATPEAPVQSAPAPRLRVILATDRSIYSPGESVAIRGFIRQEGSQAFEIPDPGQSLDLDIQGPSGVRLRKRIVLDASGMIDATLALPANAPSGVYRLFTPRDERAALQFYVHPPSSPLRASITRITQDQVVVSVRTPEDLPIAGATITWTIDPEPILLPVRDDFVFSRPETPLASLSGVGVTNEQGMLTLALPSDWYHVRIQAQIVEAGGLAATLDRTIYTAPAPAVGLRAATSLVGAGGQTSVEVVTLAGDQPLAAQRVQIDAVRLNGETASDMGVSPSEWQLLSRVITTDNDGRATFAVSLPEPGVYRVRAALVGGGLASPPTDIVLRAYQPGFTAWSEPRTSVSLVADRARYQPGDTALLLPLAPIPEGLALLTVQRASGDVVTELRTVRAGEPLTLTLTPADAPVVRVTLTSGVQSPAYRRLQVDVPVTAITPSLLATVTTDAQTYDPGATAALTITVTDARGAPVSADVLVRITAGDDDRQEPVVWRTGRTDRNGVIRFDAPLPQTPGTHEVRVWVAGERGFGVTGAALQARQPIVGQIVAPQFARAGDRFVVGVRLTTQEDVPRQTRITMRMPDGTAVVQTTAVPTEGAALATFTVQAPSSGAAMAVQAIVEADDAFSETLRTDLSVLPPATTVLSTGSALVTDRFEAAIPAPQARWGSLDIAVAPSLDALALEQARALAALADRHALDNVAIILMAASLADARQETQIAVDHLAKLQAADGGWTWKRQGSSSPVVTAATLEVLARAKESGFAVPDTTLERAINLASRLANDPVLSLETRICLSYALTQLDAPVPREWDENALNASGLACRLLMLPPDQARIDPALPRLISLAQRTQTEAWWTAPDGGAFPHDDVATTAIAARAVHHASPRHPLTANAARWLISRMTPAGWGDAYTTARVVQALRAIAPASTPATVAMTLNGAPVVAPAAPDAVLRIVPIPLSDLRPVNTLVVTGDGNPALVAWQVTSADHAALPAEGVGLIREFLDPQTGVLLDPARLRVGQLIKVRLTCVAHTERHFVTLRDAFPAGFVPVDAGSSPVFRQIDLFSDRIELAVEALAPGIYQYTYLVRAVTPGSYAVPPPELILPGARALTGTATTTVVQIVAP